MGDVLKIAGKDPNQLVKGVAVDENGYLLTKRIYESKTITLFEYNLTSDNTEVVVTTSANEYDITDYAYVSLLFENNTNSKVNIMPYMFWPLDNSQKWVKNIDGVYYNIAVPVNSITIVTPDDYPVLNYIKNLSFKITFSGDAVTENKSFKIHALLRR